MNKNDYLLSGAVETALTYYYHPMIGATRTTGADGIVTAVKGICRFYINKHGLEQLKDKTLNQPYEELEKEYSDFIKKWDGLGEEIYTLATTSTNWKSAWHRLNQLSHDMWYESYKVESPDSYAEEIETYVTTHLKEQNIDPDLFHELIEPAEPTVAQQAFIDVEAVRNSQMTRQQYLHTYWYVAGTWYGGEILSEAMLDERLAHSHPSVNYQTRQDLQNRIDAELSTPVRKLVHSLRLLTLWREIRKVQLQKLNLAYAQVIKQASRELDIEPTLIGWARIDELTLEKNQLLTLLSERRRSNVLLMDGVSSDGEILVDEKAQALIQEFSNISPIQELKGTVASRGNVSSEVSVILRESHFSQFKDGNVLVTTMTRPEFVPLMRRASAIVTDEGGLTCHAAIVARELGKPCIVGTKVATKALISGDRIEVNAMTGVIRKLAV